MKISSTSTRRSGRNSSDTLQAAIQSSRPKRNASKRKDTRRGSGTLPGANDAPKSPSAASPAQTKQRSAPKGVNGSPLQGLLTRGMSAGIYN